MQLPYIIRAIFEIAKETQQLLFGEFSQNLELIALNKDFTIWLRIVLALFGGRLCPYTMMKEQKNFIELHEVKEDQYFFSEIREFESQ